MTLNKRFSRIPAKKRFVKIGIVSLGAVVMLLSAVHHTRAQGPNPSTITLGTAAPADPQPANPVPHILIASFMTGTFPSPHIVESAATFQPVDTKFSFDCVAPGGCTVEYATTQSVYGTTSDATDYWYALAAVDGSATVASQGYLPTDGNLVTGTFANSVHVAQGSHSLQTFVYSTDGLDLAYWHTVYRVYIP